QRLQQGTLDMVTLTQTQQTLFTAQDALAQIRLNRLQAVIQLYQALGGGWLPLPPPPPNPPVIVPQERPPPAGDHCHPGGKNPFLPPGPPGAPQPYPPRPLFNAAERA